MKKSTSFWITAAFVALAGYGLMKGYQAQSKTETPPKETAYSYTSKNNGTASGTVGTPKVGLEYKVENLSQPKVKVATKFAIEDEDIYTRVNYDSKTGRKDFYAQTDVNNNGETIKAKTTFNGDKSRFNVGYKKTFKDKYALFNDVGLSYTESLGKKHARKFDSNITFDWFGFPISWSPSYDIDKGVFNLGRIKRV